jgi:hypothetical protein
LGEFRKKIKSTKDLIDKVQQLPPCSTSISTEKNIKIALDEMLLQEETLWKSKSRENWLTCTNLNTKLFHTSTLISRRSNAVNFLKTNAGGWISDRIEIGGNFVDRFSSLFSSTIPQLDAELLELFPPIISVEDNQSLISIPTEKEVFEVLSSLGSSKAPGPDGFSALFYKKYWSIVKREVLECVLDFFLNKNLASKQNHTCITLIPKQSGAHSVNHFRPIRLSPSC